MLDDNLNWEYHMRYILEKFSKGLGMVKYCCNFLPTNCLVSLYYSFVYLY